MKTNRIYVGLGALAAIMALGLVIQSGPGANAQEATLQDQANQTDQSIRTNQRQNQIQTRNQNPVGVTTPETNRRMMAFKASELIGMNVRGKSGEDEIGEIHDIMLGSKGKVKYVAVSFGGFLGFGEKLFAVPYEAVEFVREGEERDDLYARIDVTEETLKAKRGFDQDNWPQEADETFLQSSAQPRQVERTDAVDRNQPR